MLTFRRSLAAAVFLIAFIYLLRSSHSSYSAAHPATERVRKHGNQLNQELPLEQKDDVKPKQQSLTPPPSTPPSASAPLRERLRYQFPYDLEAKFPAYIWQTWKYSPSSAWFDEDLRACEASWTEMHPGFVHEVVTDDMQSSLIKHLYAPVSDVYEAFDAMPLAVLKADFFRYLILLARGGIYSDIDTTALKSAADWLPRELDQSTIGLVVGIEADPDRPDWHEWYSRRIQFCQWTIQAKPGHPVLRDMVAMVTEETLKMKKAGHLKSGSMDKTVVEFTGPAAWTDAVFRYLNNPNYFEPGVRNVTYTDFTGQEVQKKIGDVVVLPITSFSPGVQQMGAKDYDDPMAFVKHDFGGKFD